MQFDLMLVIGLVILGFSIPAILSAFNEGRPPRIAAIILLIGGGLVAIPLTQKPDGYTFDDVPRAFTRVVGYYLR